MDCVDGVVTGTKAAGLAAIVTAIPTVGLFLQSHICSISISIYCMYII